MFTEDKQPGPYVSIQVGFFYEAQLNQF